MKTVFSASFAVVLFIIAPITNAALYQGTITGTANIWPGYSAPFSDGDPFTLTLLVDTSYLMMPPPSANGAVYTSAPGLQLLLDIGGYTGTFGNFGIEIWNDMYGIDRFSVFTALDDPSNIFNGSPNSNIGFTFDGPTTVLQNVSLAQTFSFTDFNPSNISFDANSVEYVANLTMTSGNYAAAVPIPSAMYLFAPALAGLAALARCKEKEEIKK